MTNSVAHIENIGMTVIPVIIEKHAEEAAFNWLLRDAAIRAPHYSLEDLTALDNRVEAHIDGLRIAGNEGWEICKETLSLEEAGEAFTAAVLAFESYDNDRIQTVLEVGGEPQEVSRGIVSALGWLSYKQAEGHINNLLNEQSPILRCIGIAACAIHRQDPGQLLCDAVSDTDLLLKARALKAVGELGRRDLVSLVKRELESEDDGCRFYAALSGALIGEGAAASVLRDLARGNGPHAAQSCDMALRTMDLPEAHLWQVELAGREETRRLAVIGAGVIGDPVLVPWLLEMMKVPETARVAGESFTMITGIDIAYDGLEGEWPEGFEAGPTETPEDEDVEMDPDEDLAWPAPELIQNWWKKNNDKYENGTRYLLGKAINKERLQHALRNGMQRQRRAAALELSLMQATQQLFEVRAPGLSQKRLLGIK